MPYITVRDNIYIHEHMCDTYHFGDMAVVRKCCVKDALMLKEFVLTKRFTASHLAYIAFIDAWNSLSYAEMVIVGNVVYTINGFVECNNLDI